MVSIVTSNKKSSSGKAKEINMGESKIGQSRLSQSLANWSRTIQLEVAPKAVIVKCQPQQEFEFLQRKVRKEVALTWDKEMAIKCSIIKLLAVTQGLTVELEHL